MNENIYSKIADALVLDGYLVLDKSIGNELCMNLLFYAKEEKGFKQAGISSMAAKHVNKSKRADNILWLNKDDSVQCEYLDFMKGLQAYLNRTLFMGLSYYESHFAIYAIGDFYERHLDAFRHNNQRVLTTVYYLNDIEQGGELVIYNEDDSLLASINPKADKLVMFLSDKFPHEVLKTKEKRYSIAGWFRVD